MKKAILAAIIGLSVVACPILYFLVGPKFDGDQIDILIILGIIASASGIYCFIVGEITKNNSQMDKLWSLLPEVYIWIIAIKGGMNLRLIIMASLATLWGIRLTFNFARKGAYHLKFWKGIEDYRWSVLRNKKEFQPHWKWMVFNFLFISVYQNVLVLATTFPALVAINSTVPFGWVDILAAVLMLGFIVYEFIADEQQWKFHRKKLALLKEGKSLEDLPEPFSKGFNTTGLWKYSRHPNYFAEQCVWISLYIFSIGAGIGIFNWSIIGALLLIVLFVGSSNFAEEISKGKYPAYNSYYKQTSRFIPWKRRPDLVLEKDAPNEAAQNS